MSATAKMPKPTGPADPVARWKAEEVALLAEKARALETIEAIDRALQRVRGKLEGAADTAPPKARE